MKIQNFSKDVNIELYADIEFRSQFGTTVTETVDGETVEKFIPYKSMSDVLTVSTKEVEGEYTSCKLSDEKVLYSTKNGYEFHYLKICDLTLKEGVTYSLKIQVELNLHFEEFFFLNSENAIISLI